MKGLRLCHHRGSRSASCSLSHTVEPRACAQLPLRLILGVWRPPQARGGPNFKAIVQCAEDEEYKLAGLSLELNSHFKAFIDELLC